jgi:hypothetical protein
VAAPLLCPVPEPRWHSGPWPLRTPTCAVQAEPRWHLSLSALCAPLCAPVLSTCASAALRPPAPLLRPLSAPLCPACEPRWPWGCGLAVPCPLCLAVRPSVRPCCALCLACPCAPSAAPCAPLCVPLSCPLCALLPVLLPLPFPACAFAVCLCPVPSACATLSLPSAPLLSAYALCLSHFPAPTPPNTNARQHAARPHCYEKPGRVCSHPAVGVGVPPTGLPTRESNHKLLDTDPVPCYLRTMWDFITALIGGKHCGWCTDKPDGYLMRRFDGTGPRSARPLTHQAFWLFLDFNYWLGIWKLGQEWHYRIHERRKGQATWR